MSILNTITVCLFTVIFIVAIFTVLREEEFAKAAACAVVGLCLFGLYFSLFGEQTGNVSKGEYYATQCQLIETNIDNGLFQSNTNKLKCGDVIENVTVDEYQQAIQAYQGSGN
ncbi:hypothetical protein [Providencia alcalifaciens]|uniref:hypothetical protein n=1 Tax=Providencia alcalifaciens TaxID=126385 RepID=UPI0005642275|nr:hypothetical protein [Providencia alcalifaciens]CAG9437058.1 hypothetical protein NVI2019_OGMBKCAO_04153 [Providencia alcalifaciens]CAG9437125.1 hypothetical protein NVI2019_ANGEOOBF_04161 [Providencia alcalifaciens]CAG9437157.1 hypothetical protein NVI2019_KOLGMIGM_04169 [Providencia alcalifaciens]CAG9437224.1 hypothetical protein NVI2019_PLFLNFOB_04172 [Providencia alcalifaciens]CAG9437670.1 hypothetical protein NVI2019_OHEONHNH_04160 [Providencia alcalifaciens]